MSILYFIFGQLGWFACVLSAARGEPWIGLAIVILLVACHLLRSPRPVPELKLIAATAVIGAVWDSGLYAAGLLGYHSGILLPDVAPFWIIALWALFAAQFNTTYTWLKNRLWLAALLGALAGPITFHAGARLGALQFEAPWAGTAALTVGWACLLPLVALLSRRWDGVGAAAKGIS